MTEERVPPLPPVASPGPNLAQDLKGIAIKADDLLKQTGHHIAERIAAKSHVAAEKAACTASAAQAYLHENPWKVVGAAALAGLLLGRLLDRR